MSETRSEYVVSGRPRGPTATSMQPFDSPGYTQPLWTDIRAVVECLGLSGSQIGTLLGVNSRTVRRWTSPPDNQNSLPIPYAAWRLLLITAELVPPPNKTSIINSAVLLDASQH
jgi:hypothetical protein